MIFDHYHDKWWQPPVIAVTPAPVPAITPQEIEEFRRLLERAREYDRKNNQPDCELAEKKKKMLDLAKQLGVDISFIEKEEEND